MPRRAKGPRLWFDKNGRKEYVIRDGKEFVRTGCGQRDSKRAEELLKDYLGQKHRPTPSSSPMIAEVLAAYGSEVAPHLKSARNLGYNISNLLRWWGDKTVRDITPKTCRAYIATKTEPAAGADLKALKWAVKHWNMEYGPLDVMPQFYLPQPNPPRERWLTRSEAAALLWHARRYQHIRRFVLLGLYTGSRPGVLLALEWAQVDLRHGLLSRMKPGELGDKKKRQPKVRLGRRILAHLRRWRRMDDKNERLVCYLKDLTHPTSREVIDPHGAWFKVIAASGLKGVTRHTLRHTRATWLMQRGANLWDAAGFLGMSVRTLERVYGHHHPGHHGGAEDL